MGYSNYSSYLIQEKETMQTVNIADLKNNLSAYLAKVQNGEELLVKDRNRTPKTL